MIYWLIVILSVLTRLLFLNIIPPSYSNIMIRLPTAIFGVVSIILFISIIKRFTGNRNISLLSGIFLAISPWHLEQSRVYSEVLISLTLIIFTVWVFKFLPCKICKILLPFLLCIVILRIYPSFWLFTGNWKIPVFTDFINNLFKLISVEFLFYKNDSFWWGGLRTYGTMLPTFIPIFLTGLYFSFKNNIRKNIYWFIIFIIIWIISAASPFFPESREFFLISPFFAYLLGLGFYKLIIFTKKNLLFKGFFIIYLIILLYEYLIFAHFYIKHYPQRIKSEVQNEKINF